ncbi:MAG TPA: DUF222 domain-containing protein [Pseudonocardiaceae bacterium]
MGRELWQQDSAELVRVLHDLETRMRRDYAAQLELIAELDSGERGYPSLREFLRDVLRISRSEANRRIGHAHATTEVQLVSGGTVDAPLPATAQALRAGELGPEHVETVAKTLRDLPASVSVAERRHAEGVLVAAAASMDAATLARLGVQVRARLDQDGRPPSDVELVNPVNELRFVTKPNGRTAFRGELDPEASALFQTVLSPLAKPRPSTDEGPDPRTAAERHGDALVEILRLAADSAGVPSEAGERPHLLVTVPLQVLQDGVGSALLDGAGLLDAASARRIACDCKLVPVVLGANSEPLDIGRSSYTVSTAQRRALIVRDGGCAFPGCDRPHRWCHAHHVTHWADGGATALDNLVLLCGRHHRLVHHSEWECAIVNGRAEFYPPGYIDPLRKPRRNTMHPCAA